MFGCVGTREKTGPASSVRPSAPVGTDCGVNSLTISFNLKVRADVDVSHAGVTVVFQRLEQGSWSSRWVALTESRWELQGEWPRWHGGREDQHVKLATDKDFSIDVPCRGSVAGLEPETQYTLKILARGSCKEQYHSSEQMCGRTADRPNLHTVPLSCTGRWAHSVEISCLLPDPPGAPVQECELQYRLDSMMSSWMSIEGGDLRSVTREGRKQLWIGSVRGLKGATSYRVRARAKNAVGWSPDHSPELVCDTSDLPAPPRDLIFFCRRPYSVSLAFTVDDPEGAPVNNITAQVNGMLGFTQAESLCFELDAPVVNECGRNVKASRRGFCTLDCLQPEMELSARLWAHNDAGSSRSPSPSISLMTSERPQSPAALFVQVGPRSVEVDWDLVDPEGAPVLTCEIEFCKDSMFAAWEVAEASPVAFLKKGSMNYDVTAMAAAMAVADVTALPRMQRRWSVRVDGLEKETAYVLRARSCNTVGWSANYSQTVVAKTTDRPPPPQNLRCAERRPAAVLLELTVAEVLGTAPVTGIVVEQCGSFSWHEVSETEMNKLTPETEGASHWQVLVPLGRCPGVVHKLRAWASNTFGRCHEPSNVCICRTSDKPDTPRTFSCIGRMPHALVLTWSVPDPEGAPVLRFEVQCRKDTAFASWQAAVCADTVRSGADGKWRCVVEQLEPCSTYQICVRAWNAAGWSEWRVEDESDFTTSRVSRGVPSKLSLRRMPGVQGCDGSSLPSNVVVDMSLVDPEGAPVVACMVKCREQGPWALARRFGCSSPGRWIARFPSTLGTGGAQVTIYIRVANAVSWSEEHRLSDIWPAEEAVDGAPAACDGIIVDDAVAEASGGEGSAVELVVREVQTALQNQLDTKERITALVNDASARGDQDHTALLARYSVEVEQRMEALREVAKELDPEVTSVGDDQGAQLVKQFQTEMQRPKLLTDPKGAAKVLALLLRGYMWLDVSWYNELRNLSKGIEEAMASVPAGGGRVLHQWAKQHQTWSESFDLKVSAALPGGVGTATQLLATLVSGRKLELFKTVRSDLVACFTLVSAAERQLKRLRQSNKILRFSEASSCQNFEAKGVLQKIETTALGVLTMLVLPLPGSIEVGTVGIGMLWIEGDGGAGSHLALEHPTGAPLAPMLERLGSSPPPKAAVILAGWASGGHKGVVLVHNATARRITVTILPDSTSLGSKAYSKLSDAHPMVKVVGSAMSAGDGGDHVSTILPTDVALIQVPPGRDLGTDSAQAPLGLEFAYGTASHAERAMGRASVSMGTAVTFMNLDGSLQVSNIDAGNFSVEEGTITIINNDLAPVKVNVYPAPEAQSTFQKALVTDVFQSAEDRQLPLPQPCGGRIFQVEVVYDDGRKALCEVRPGQKLLIESMTTSMT